MPYVCVNNKDFSLIKISQENSNLIGDTMLYLKQSYSTYVYIQFVVCLLSYLNGPGIILLYSFYSHERLIDN